MARPSDRLVQLARTLLREVRSGLWVAAWSADAPDGANLAHVATEAEHAEDALFNVLNAAHSHLGDADAGEVMFRDGEVIA